ncbi:hypothetical protein I2492_10900 [Budviciaceae bacterium CWB-B4]|uniref:Uncharacterized protein n=1 Tax=Limnobaculum xujianqingii TaxID=2738837 RepID=A0A9D7AJ04_9GAMM|nr:hypothetical protein [Limnobaculum xujianqingii]MBK5176829.1 hypothetical protein [Limnobaculum xujianqingii]
MMDIHFFKKNISPKLTNYTLKYSSYPNGDFGDLERVEVQGENKIGGIDFWSQGWIDIDIYDLTLDEQLINVLLDPNEMEAQEKAIYKFLKILLDEK